MSTMDYEITGESAFDLLKKVNEAGIPFSLVQVPTSSYSSADKLVLKTASPDWVGPHLKMVCNKEQDGSVKTSFFLLGVEGPNAKGGL